LQLYALIFPTMDGSLLIEAKSISIDRTTNSQPVSTLAKGYAGESPGAAMSEFTVDSAIPANGFEFDMGKKMAALSTGHLYLLGPGGQQYKGEVFVFADSVKSGVNQEAAYSFRARGPMTLWS
jgi:hypothetical protein